MKKISFCIVCMNRCHHLKQTLFQNIKDNDDYFNLEFVLLDYNSTDGLETYVKVELKQYLDSAKLVYYKTSSPEYFNRSHSRNLVFRLATGEVLCNLDADNFTGKGFAAYLNRQFTADKNVFIKTNSFINSDLKKDVLGRIAMKKTDFHKIGGFDERMEYYGFEDYDIINRLLFAGIKNVDINENKFLRALTHSNEERLSNEFVRRNFKELYINYINHINSVLLILFINGDFKMAIAQNNIAFNAQSISKSQDTPFEYGIIEDNWVSGNWIIKESMILLKMGRRTSKKIYIEENCDTLKNAFNKQHRFYKVINLSVIEDVLFFTAR